MIKAADVVSTDLVSPADRIPFWAASVHRLFGGLNSDLYGDHDFEGRFTTSHAGPVILTRLEANRHRVMRSGSLARASELAYLKIVAPFHGCANVEQQGRQAWVTPGEWSIYDTTDTYAVSNPTRVEHLIVMVPKQHLAERGLAIGELMARRLGAHGGIARVALETMRSAYDELPGMTDEAASSVGEAITQFVHLSLLELAGHNPGASQREALRERIKHHVTRRLGDPSLSVHEIAQALNCSRRHLYNAFSDEPEGVAGFILQQRLEACRRELADTSTPQRSITEIALSWGFNNLAHFSRVFKTRYGASPSDYRATPVAPDAL
jgi:AraC-like DNA-binding protein